ncbi:MAG: hypothetical protein HYS57_00005, partial [Parcubacteria group bacterium]|nr:hypothetical protein [Parcubacteria group bacterium]
MPNFVLRDFALTDTNASYTIVNEGTGAYAGPLRAVYSWAGNSAQTVASTTEIFSVSLPVGSSVSRTFTHSLISSPPAEAVTFWLFINPQGAGHVTELSLGGNSEGESRLRPDLAIENASVAVYTVSYTLRNVGNSRYNGPLRIQYAWQRRQGSGYTSITGAGSVATENITVDLAPSARSARTFTFSSVPINAARLSISLDPNMEITLESTRINNFAYPIYTPPQPDFFVTSGQVSGANATYVLKNGNDRYTGALTNLYSWLGANDLPLATRSATALYLDLATNATTSLSTSSFVPPTGSRKFRIALDSPPSVTEANEDNNVFDIVRPLADLVIQNATVTLTSIEYRVQNVGQIDFPGTFVSHRYAWFDAGGVELSSSTFEMGSSGIPSGGSFVFPSPGLGSARYAFIAYPPAGSTRLRITVNLNGTIEELSATNNSLEVTPRFPDFVPVFPTLSPTSTLRFSIRNDGIGPYSGGMTVGYQWLNSDRGVVSSTTASAIINVAPGASAAVSPVGPFFGFPPSAARYLKIVVDPSGTYRELDENNNVVEVTRPLPDFSIFSAEFSTSVQSGTGLLMLDFGYTVRNSGASNYNGNLSIARTWLDSNGDVISSVSGNPYLSLPVGDSETLSGGTSDVINPPGRGARLRISVNPVGAVAESDLSNNTREVERPAFPDLSIEGAALRDFGVYLSVRNLGPYQFGGSLERSYEWLDSAGAAISSTILSSTVTLRPQSAVSSISESSSFLTNPPEGAASLRITLDPADATYELEEFNNVREIILTTGETGGDELAEADEEEVVEEIEADLDDEVEPSPSPVASPSGSSSVRAKPSPTASPSVSGKVRPHEPRPLPGPIGLIVKDFVREVKSSLTFDPQAKAELRLRYANERVLEAHAAVEQGDASKAARILEKYTRDVNRAEDAISRVSSADKSAAERLREDALEDQLRHQVLFGRFERKVSPEILPRIQQVREHSLQQVGVTISALDGESKVTRVVEKTLHANGSEFRQLRNLEVLQAVEERVPEQAKSVIRNVEERQTARAQAQLEAISIEKTQTLSEYIDQSGGNEGFYLKAIEKVEKKVENKAEKEKISVIKEVLSKHAEKAPLVTPSPKRVPIKGSPFIKGTPSLVPKITPTVSPTFSSKLSPSASPKVFISSSPMVKFTPVLSPILKISPSPSPILKVTPSLSPSPLLKASPSPSPSPVLKASPSPSSSPSPSP